MFTMLALILLLWGWGWLKSAALFQKVQTFTVQFGDVAGLNKSAPVNINGVRVGIIDDMELRAKGQVFVRVKITAPNVTVTKGSTFTIQTLGLVGAKYIEISLPTPDPNQPAPPPIAENEIVTGQDPVRVELVLNDVAVKVSKVFQTFKGEEIGDRISVVLDNSSEAAKSIKSASSKLDKNMDRVLKAADNFSAASVKIGSLADRARSTAGSAEQFFAEGRSTLGNIGDAATEFKGTSTRMNKILDHPNFSKDIRETLELTKQTADSIANSIHSLNTTLKDQPVRQDLLAVLHSVDRSTANIAQSMQTIDTLAKDGQLRADVKQITSDAREAMSKLGAVLTQPEFKADISKTINSVKSAADNVDVAARQLRQVLDKRAPLLRMMFGRPGRLREETKTKEPAAAPSTAPVPETK